MKPMLLAAAMFVAALLALAPAAGAQDRELQVLPARFMGNTSDTMMHQFLMARARQAFVRDEAQYERRRTPEQITAWQGETRRRMIEQFGGFPERTPLNARVTGKLDRGDYRIEKVIFESEPHHTVTALLYLPKTKPPYPGVLLPCGHSANGKAYEGYQRASILLARNGMAVLCYDPIDQGERFQMLDEAGKARFSSTVGHYTVGVGAILLGRNTARYEIWDGIRALDYLLSRPEVDPKRIGCTGISGGGTQTSYLMAVEPRITAAAPGCYLTSMARLLETIGPQDAEQTLNGQIADGLGHADYLMLFAPRPALILSATQDFFDISGTWDTFRKAKRAYTRLGHPERMDLAEADEKHGYTAPLRAAAACFLRRWLVDAAEPVAERAGEPILADREAWCAPEGLVLRLPGERTVYDMQVEEETRLAAVRRKLWSEDMETALREVRRLSGIRPLAEVPAASCEAVGTLAREDYHIQKLILRTEPGIVLPALAFMPARPAGAPVLYLNGDGKQADAAPGGPIEKLVRQGRIVLAVDPRGTGETVDPGHSYYIKQLGTDWVDVSLSLMLGTSYVAQRAEDVLTCARFLSTWPSGGGARRVHVIATGVAGPAALHAVVLEPKLFDALMLRGSLNAWADLIRAPRTTGQFANVVHGALKAYDLPDLRAILPPGVLTVE